MKNRDLEKEQDLQREKYNELLSEKSRLEYELNELRAERESLLKQEGEIRALHESIRQIKHDMRNHLMVIGSYLSDGDYDNAKDYTSKILDKLNSARSYVDTGNSLMNHILNEKLNFAREKGISVKAEIENLSFSKMESLDFSAMLSNILDNALEASIKEKAPEIIVTISAKRGYETISVKNRITASVLARNPDLCTEKADKHKHGIGVKQIKAAAEKNGGMYDFYEEEGYFCVCVFIPA